jgi:diguanylate cyclase (GGDEF)-like protein
MKTIVLISQDMVLISIVGKILEEFYGTVVFRNMQSALDYIYNSMPNLMVVDIAPNDHSALEILNNLKEDPIFKQVPVLALLADGHLPHLLWDEFPVEDFLLKSDLKEGLAPRVGLCILRSERAVEINPLTRLPGNISINKQIQGRLDTGEEFALAYADLDHFKPFNDFYGFSRGDEVLRMTARLITNTVKGKQPKNSFVGHVGGDDYVFIMDPYLVGETASEIIDAFDRIVPTFYDVEDRERTFIQSLDRQGNPKSFNMITVSIGIAHNGRRGFSHYGQLTEIASEMKGHAKRHKGSCARMDRRQALP